MEKRIQEPKQHTGQPKESLEVEIVGENDLRQINFCPIGIAVFNKLRNIGSAAEPGLQRSLFAWDQ